MAMTPAEIQEAHAAFEKVRSIDSSIEWLGRDAPDKVAEHGGKVRGYLGQNRMSHFTDAHLGEVVLCAVINALLDRRNAIATKVSGLVELPDPPCPRQVVQEQED